MNYRHDFHTHTLHSSCCYDPEATISAFVDKASELGLHSIGISNHVWDETVPGSSGWYKGQTVKYVLEGKCAIPEDTKGVKVMFGCECEYCGMSDTLGMTAENGKKFDYVLVPHTHTHMKNFVIAENDDVKQRKAEIIAKLCSVEGITEDIAKRMVGTYKYAELLPERGKGSVDEFRYLADFCFNSFETMLANPEFKKLAAATPTFIAHPFHPCGFSSADDVYAVQSMFDTDRLYADFKAAADMNVGLDINISTYKKYNDPDNDSMIKIMRIAKEAGCKFIFGTDTHSLKGLENISRDETIMHGIGIDESHFHDIVK